jgi:hypothetical protein
VWTPASAVRLFPIALAQDSAPPARATCNARTQASRTATTTSGAASSAPTSRNVLRTNRAATRGVINVFAVTSLPTAIRTPDSAATSAPISAERAAHQRAAPRYSRTVRIRRHFACSAKRTRIAWRTPAIGNPMPGRHRMAATQALRPTAIRMVSAVLLESSRGLRAFGASTIFSPPVCRDRVQESPANIPIGTSRG